MHSTMAVCTSLSLLLLGVLMCIPLNHGFVVVVAPSSTRTILTSRVVATTTSPTRPFTVSSSSASSSSTTVSTVSTTTLFAAATTPAAPNSTVAEPEAESSSTTTMTRDERYDKALAEAKLKKVGELKQELLSRGISTKSFFEKTEFEKAYATAMADNVPVGSSGSGSSSGSSSNQQRGSTSSTKTSSPPKADEPMDPTYRDVTMQKFNRQAYGGQSVIDVRLPTD